MFSGLTVSTSIQCILILFTLPTLPKSTTLPYLSNSVSLKQTNKQTTRPVLCYLKYSWATLLEKTDPCFPSI